jgi:hypothetical protein
MKLRSAVLCAVALTFVSVSQNEASAAGRRGRVVQSEPTATAPGPLMTTPTTIIPTGDEIRAVPAPGGGRLIGYGLNLHPGGRVARMLLSR